MNRLYFLVLATAILLCGCATKRGDLGVSSVSSYFAGATKGAKDCDKKDCQIPVTPSCLGTACGGTPDYDPIELKNQNPNVKVTWTLDKGYGFCKLLGDGVSLKSETSDQFKPEPSREDDAKKCSDSFYMTAVNGKSRPNEPYLYKILFHKIIDASTSPPTVDPTQYFIDPSMVNK